jgi:hypothetical protein
VQEPPFPNKENDMKSKHTMSIGFQCSINHKLSYKWLADEIKKHIAHRNSISSGSVRASLDEDTYWATILVDADSHSSIMKIVGFLGIAGNKVFKDKANKFSITIQTEL